MLFPRTWPRTLLVLGLLSLFSLPSLADNAAPPLQSPTPVVFGKGKKGDDPPRPKPAPGPREGGDDD